VNSEIIMRKTTFGQISPGSIMRVLPSTELDPSRVLRYYMPRKTALAPIVELPQRKTVLRLLTLPSFAKGASC
jgi:hypothetical protein